MTSPQPAAVDLDLLEQIHDVALGRASWAEILACLKDEFSTEASLLALYQRRPEEARGLATSDPDGRRWQAYAEHFAAIDPFAASIRAGRVPAGIIVTGDDLVPARTFCASEYFNDWFRPNGMRHTARGYIRIRDGLNLQLGMPRSARAGPYSADEIARLQCYFNHIRRALQAQEEIRARTAAPDFDRIARTYGLTPAEARLLEALTQCGSLRRSAECAHRSYYTLRAQLRTVFQKTATRSQIELMHLIHQTGLRPRDLATWRSSDS